VKSEKLSAGKNEEMRGERPKSVRKLKGFTGNETLQLVKI